MSNVERAENNASAMAGRVDIIRAEITRNALMSAAAEMNRTLVRSAYNPLIFDVKDFGVGIMSAEGDLWSDAPGLPVFTGVLPASVKSGLAKFGPEGFHEGDVLVVNSPYLNGTHISDTAVYMPVFYDGQLVAFTGSMAHWADVGGMSPGGWTVNSSEIFQEGIAFTHQRLFIAGEPNHDILDLIENNMRVPHIVLGDIRAQIATCRTGAQRITALCDRYGASEVIGLMAYVMEQTEKSLRQRIEQLPDGEYRGAFTLDFSGVDPDEVPHVELLTRIEGDRILVSFEGTSKASSGPINAGAEAVSATVAEALKGILDPTGPANQAHLNLAEITWPDYASIVNPQKPAPCDSYGYVMTALVETMQLSLAEIAPDRVRAGGYQMTSTYIMSTRADSDGAYVFAEPVQGGAGAFPGHDGASMIFVTDGDASNTPVEVLELRFPVRCERFELDVESPGLGEFRGGAGVRRDMAVLQRNSLIKTAQENTKDPLAKGVQGGTHGAAPFVELHYPDGIVQRRDSRISDEPVPVGTVLSTHTGGGGGFGRPFARDPEAVARDVRDEYVTLRDARSLYGVALVPGSLPGLWSVDVDETARLREVSDAV